MDTSRPPQQQRYAESRLGRVLLAEIRENGDKLSERELDAAVTAMEAGLRKIGLFRAEERVKPDHSLSLAV